MTSAQIVSVVCQEPEFSTLRSGWKVKNWGHSKPRKPRSLTLKVSKRGAAEGWKVR